LSLLPAGERSVGALPGGRMKARIKTNGALIFVAVAATALFPRALLRMERTPADTLASHAGFFLLLAGQLIRVSARGYKSRFSRNGHALIRQGPYRMVRNPMYLGIILIGAGIVAALFKGWAFIVFALCFVARYTGLVAEEEKKLLAFFPAEYPRYAQSVPRIIPKLS
jgi:protein-S-isoprenylcysteine O-methyltransferase Ste14